MAEPVLTQVLYSLIQWLLKLPRVTRTFLRSGEELGNTRLEIVQCTKEVYIESVQYTGAVYTEPQYRIGVVPV